jgi:hypothetical protein
MYFIPSPLGYTFTLWDMSEVPGIVNMRQSCHSFQFASGFVLVVLIKANTNSDADALD